jgi:hypothetical protein
MGCGSSTGDGDKIQMQKTKLAGMDEFFDDVQAFVDDFYEIKDPIDDAKDALLESTDLEKVEGANTHHATVGTVFSIAAQGNGADVANIFEVLPKEPFIQINKGSAAGKTAESVDNLTEYIKAFVAAQSKIQPLAEKAQSFAEKAPDLPGKAKDEVGNAGDLGTMDKLRAVKNTGTNCKMMAKLPALITELKDTVADGIAEIQAACKELNAKKGDLGNIGKKCAEKKKVSPKDCYLECGDAIGGDAEAKKKWQKNQTRKKKKAKAAGNAPAKAKK